MTIIKKVVYGDEEPIELAIPVYMSDDKMEFTNKVYRSASDSVSARAFFLFNIVQKQIEQLMERLENVEVRQPKDDTSHPFADDVLMGGD